LVPILLALLRLGPAGLKNIVLRGAPHTGTQRNLINIEGSLGVAKTGASLVSTYFFLRTL